MEGRTLKNFDKIRQDVADCTLSLGCAIQEAGGRIDPEMLSMSLGEFITSIAGQNNIRFIYKRPERDTHEQG